MCSFQPDWHRADPAVVAAEGAPVLVGRQHQLTHAPVPLPPYCRKPLGLRRLQFQPGGFAQLTVERGRKVSIKQQLHYLLEQFRFASQGGPQFRRESPGGTRFPEISYTGTRTVVAAIGTHCPHAVADQMVEPVGGRRPVGRPELGR
jgi:hypothetical protein